MSLIPSESYSFPDHFTSTVTPSRKPKQKPEAEKPVPRKPAIVALPDPEPEPALETFVAAEPAVEEEVLPAIWEPEPLPAIAEPTPEPELMAEIWEPEIPEVKAPPPPPARPAPRPTPNPALRRAQAPPPKVQEAPVRKIALPATLKPKVRWNNRAAPLDPNRNGANGNGNGAHQPQPMPAPAQNVIPMKMARPAPPMPQPAPTPRPVQPQPIGLKRPAQAAPVSQKPVQAPPVRKPVIAKTEARPLQPRPRPAVPKPAPVVVPTSQADFFEAFAEDGYDLANKRRKQMKFRRFVTCEGAALLVLLPLVILGLTMNITAPAMRWIMNILTIAAAFAAVVIPIVFYAFTPTLPELER